MSVSRSGLNGLVRPRSSNTIVPSTATTKLPLPGLSGLISTETVSDLSSFSSCEALVLKTFQLLHRSMTMRRPLRFCRLAATEDDADDDGEGDRWRLTARFGGMLRVSAQPARLLFAAFVAEISF